MRKYLPVLLALVLVLSLVLVVAPAKEAKAATYNVPGDYATITLAIAAANSGDTIIVTANISDNVIVNKSVTIQGAWGSSNTTITASNPNAHVFGIGASVNYAVIKDLTITGATNASGVNLAGDNCMIDSNNVSGNLDGVSVAGAGNQIRRNLISNNTRWGIKLPGTTGGNQPYYNNILNNGSYGVYALPVSGNPHWKQWAGFNWFGSDSGPGGSGPGTGNAVNEYVWFNPWLNASQSTILATGIADISTTVPLQTGWNTLATPVALAAGSNKWNEIVTRSSLSYQQAFVYNPVSESWGELETTNTTVLNPLNAVFIKMSASGWATLKMSTLTHPPPTRALVAGWNLIGAAMSMTDQELEMWKVLKSVEQTPAGLIGYDMVVSPPLATQPSWAYVRGQEGTQGTAWADWQKMQFGRGYWIYMENADEMAGFSSTPITARVWD